MFSKSVSTALVSVVAVFAGASAHGAMLYSNVAYGASSAAAAEADFLARSNGAHLTETFDGTLAFVGEIGPGFGFNDQTRWLNAADAFITSVGTIAMTTPEAGPPGMTQPPTN